MIADIRGDFGAVTGTVEYDGKRITYATDGEMAAALADLERRIVLAEPGARRRRVLTSATKGL